VVYFLIGFLIGWIIPTPEFMKKITYNVMLVIFYWRAHYILHKANMKAHIRLLNKRKATESLVH